MNKTPIYTVTTVRHALAAGNRAVGFFYTFDEAERCLVNNYMDINEGGYYFFAVIEEGESNILQLVKKGK